jgi:serine/threonine protein kinase
MDASNGLLMAVKQVELPTGSAPNEERKKSMLSALEREIDLLKDLQHENIVQYLCMPSLFKQKKNLRTSDSLLSMMQTLPSTMIT